MKTTLATIATILLALLPAAALSAQPTAEQSSNAEPAIAAEPASDAASPAVSPEFPAEPAGASRTRIVRLSQARGAVEMDRNAGQGFEGAFPNLPVTEGARLKTGEGFAEVEFEDNSAVRLAPDSLVEFPQLELMASGAKLTTVRVLQGTVYVSRESTKGNQFTLLFGDHKVFPMPSSHLRLDMNAKDAKLAVLSGTVTVPDGPDQMEAGKKKTVTFNMAVPSTPVLANGVAENENDQWDKTSVEYQKQYARGSTFAGSGSSYGGGALPGSGYSYGLSDLNYYGSFTDIGGCGSMWQPYFVSASWSPFSNGLWAWYPGAGYSWVSPYPWGWTPFHYGSWNYCAGRGWGWMPGGAWAGLSNSGIVTSQAGKPFVPTRPNSHGPVPGSRGLIPVNLQPLRISGMRDHNTFVFRNNSAGLGVPRGDLGSLRGYSKGTEHHGLIAQPVFEAPAQTGRAANGVWNRGIGQGAGQNGLQRSGSGTYSNIRRAQPGGSMTGRPSGGAASEGGMRGGGGTQAGSGGGTQAGSGGGSMSSGGGMRGGGGSMPSGGGGGSMPSGGGGGASHGGGAPAASSSGSHGR